MQKISYSGYRFPPEIIQQAIWLYLRFTLSLRDVEDLLAERGVPVSYETVRRWVNHFGPMIAADLRKRRLKPHTTWHLDEVYTLITSRSRKSLGEIIRKLSVTESHISAHLLGTSSRRKTRVASANSPQVS